MRDFAEQKELIDTENEFFVRDQDTIEDFLYEIESSYIKKESANRFDQIDIIFLTGDSNFRPWSDGMKKILTLLRMCMKVKKLLFAASFGAQALVYLSASNVEKVLICFSFKPVSIINGKNGGNIQDIKSIHQKLQKKIQQNDFFLDNTTGDLYGYNYDSSEWLPKANIGLHYRKAAQEFQSIGKYIVKAPIYKPKDTIHQSGLLYKNKNTETICELKKTNYHHWAFTDMQTKFLTPLLNSWDVHAISFINLDKSFTPLAESDEGPSVIEFKTFLACMFDIDPRYQETPKIVKNFILHSLRSIKSTKLNTNQVSISQYHYLIKDSNLSEMLRKQHNKKTRITLKIMQSRPQVGIVQKADNKQYEEDHVQREIKHVGYSLKRGSMPDAVALNSVWDKKFKMTQDLVSGDGLTTPKDIKTPNYTMSPNPDGAKTFNYTTSPNPNGILKSTFLMASPRTISHKQMFSEPSIARGSRVNSFQNLNSPKQAIEPLDLIKIVSQTDVRSFLHPQMSETCLQQKALWIPGQYSMNEQNPNKIKTQNMTQRLYKGKSKHMPAISPQEPYISQEQIERQLAKANDSKILGNKIFKILKTSPQQVYPSFGFNDPFNPTQTVYREGDRKKWLSHNFII